MKVAHQNDYDTHAVMGGNNVKDFAIAQTAEFFTVLSNTLYSNKPLAVIREVLCNAWDSHIASGVTDIPVNITLDNNALIIRDYGAGIHPDLMHQIYCVYGASTKENDGLQTGGFGLGSKAPFAYTDHFTVTTSHAGLKTVHAISRGSGAAKGTPQLRVMVQVPTVEQGIEVNIPIINSDDIRIFSKIIKDIASFGEMNVMLNKEHIPIIPVSSAEHNIFLTRNLPYESNDLFHVRYGNVIYPIPVHEAYSTEMKKIKETVDAMVGTSYYRHQEWYMIIQAPSHSISVTPSRESISMTDTSINTLRGLLRDIQDKMSMEEESFSDRLIKIVQKDIDQMFLRNTPHKLLTLFGGPYYKETYSDREYPEYFNKLDQIAEFVLYRNTAINGKMRKRFTLMRLKALATGGFPRKHVIHKIHDLLKHEYNEDEFRVSKAYVNKFKKIVIRPIIKNLLKNNLSPKNLYATLKSHGRASIQGTEFIPLMDTKFSLDKQMEILNNVVVFTTSKTAFVENYDRMGYETRYLFPSHKPRLVWIASRKQEERERTKVVFETMGFHVIDFYTYYQENCIEDEPKIVSGFPRPARPEGVPSLKNNLVVGAAGDMVFNRTGYRNIEGTKVLVRIKDPELIFKGYKLSDHYDPRFFSFGDTKAKFIIKYWGDRSGIVANEIQWEKLISLGSKPGEIVVQEEVLDYVSNSVPIADFYRELNASTSSTLAKLRELGTYSPILRDKFPERKHLSEKDEEYLSFFHYMIEHMRRHNTKDIEIKYYAQFDAFKALGPSQDLLDAEAIVDKNRDLLETLNLTRMLELLRTNPTDRYAKTYAEIAVINALRF